MKPHKSVKQKKDFVLKPYNKKELALLYPVSVFIFSKWLNTIEKQLGKPLGRLYNVEQVTLIIRTFGIPGQVVKEEEDLAA